MSCRDPTTANDLNNPASWRASQGIGGSPGADDPEAVLINEVIFSRNDGRIAQVELHNSGKPTALIGDWVLTSAAIGDNWRWRDRLACGSQRVQRFRLAAIWFYP